MPFSKDFIWGASSAAYQIEGAAFEDNKGWSVWDMYCRRSGNVINDETGDVACDHYHRYREDVALMREIGLKGYRFSIAWPRVFPEGTGRINPKGLDFYRRLVDALCAAGVEPVVTLFHWDYPLALYQRGGWLNPESVRWFSDYAAAMVAALSDRVRFWLTYNEPHIFLGSGHFARTEGTPGCAPGDRRTLPEMLVMGRHALLGHGRAVQAMRAAARQPLKIGMAPGFPVNIPATPWTCWQPCPRAGSPVPQSWNCCWCWRRPCVKSLALPALS